MEKTHPHSFTIPDDITEQLSQFCFKNDLSKSEVVLAAILYSLPLFLKYPLCVKHIIYAEAQQSHIDNTQTKDDRK